MIQQIRGSLRLPMLHQNTIQDEILSHIANERIPPETYLKVITNNPKFAPIYFYTVEQKQIEPVEEMRKSNKSAIKDRLASVVQEHVFRYGSQVYLKMLPEPNVNDQVESGSIHYQVRSVQPITNKIYPQFSLFEVIIKNQFLTRRNEVEVKLTDESENQSIWALQQMDNNNLYRICNISSNLYLCSQRKGEAHKEKFILGLSKSVDDPSTIFIIERQSQERLQYLTLTPLKSQDRKSSSLSPSLQINSLSQRQSQSYRISLQPTANSVANLVYELSFAEEMLTNSPSLHFLNQFIQELIYYNISQFGENETLLSAPVQSLLADNLSLKILQFLRQQISSQNYNSQLAAVIGSKIRLLCLGSPQNSQIFSRLISELLSQFDQSSYLSCLTNLVASNNDLIRKFQSSGWCAILFQKLQLAFSIKDFVAFNKLLLLIAQFCKGTHSLANKYMVMHMLDAINGENTLVDNTNSLGSQNNWSKNYEITKKVNYWIRFFKDGIYEYVEVGEGDKLKEIQLETYLNADLSHRLIYMGQIALMSALCEGFSLNSINKYYKIFKQVSSYCFNQTYPFFGNSDCKQQTLSAIVASFDWTESSHRLENKYNIGCVFGDSDGSRLEKGSRDRNISKLKIQLAGNRNMYYKESDTITDVFRHFVIEFQNCMGWVYRKCKERNMSIANFMLSKELTKEKFGGNIKHWIKIFVIALDARLITVLKKRTGPYIEYFKKIFDNKKTPQKNSPKKSNTPAKKQNNRGESPSSFPFEFEKQFQNQTNVILDLLTRIIKFNLLYDLYLQQISVKSPPNRLSRETFMVRMLNMNRKSTKNFSRINANEQKIEDYNKVIFIDGLLSDNDKEWMAYVNSVKLQSCKVIALIYQNIIEENIEYEIKNLGYAMQGSAKFTNNILTLEQGFKKFPFVDQAFRLSLWENWYLTSHPQNLNELTNVLRYIYDQPQIYLRAMNTTLALFNYEAVSFYEGVQAPMLQAQRLTMCIQTWYIPQILKSSSVYYENYKMLDQALRTVNSQVRKLSLAQKNEMDATQEILENLGLFDISSKLLAHLNRLELMGMRESKQGSSLKSAQASSLANESSALYNELTQILQFYVHNNRKNKFKLLASIGEQLSQSVSALSILMFLLKEPIGMQKSIAFLTGPMIESIVLMLPHTQQFLQVVLLLFDAQFISVISVVSQALINHMKQSGPQQKMEKQIIKDRSCFKTVCKVAYRVLLLHSCCQEYLEWFYDEILTLYLQAYLSANAHFLREKFQSMPLSLVEEKSNVAFLLNALYSSNKSMTLDLNRMRRQQPARVGEQLNQYGNELRSPEGQVVIQNYILSELFVTIIENDLSQIAPYIEYYIYDLLPLLRVFNGRISKEDTKNILSKCAEYLSIYNTNNLDKSIDGLTASMTGKEVKTKLRLASMNSYDQRIALFNSDKKLLEIEKFLRQDIIPVNFIPRAKYILPPARPQIQSPHSPHKIHRSRLEVSESLKQKADSFQKMSKKAAKLWSKAKQTVNQNKETYINREKWSEDLKKIGAQYESDQRQKLINSADIISKIVSIILNTNSITLDPENLLFLIKNLIGWVKKIADLKTKKKKKGEASKNRSSESLFLVKKIEVETTIVALLQLVQSVSHKQFKNVMLICYILKLISLLVDIMQSAFTIKYEQKVCGSISFISSNIINAFAINEFLIQQYQQTKVLDSSLHITDWNPIKLLSQIVIKICKIGIFSLSSVKLLVKTFMIMRIRLGRKRSSDPQLWILDALDELRHQGEETFKQAQKQVLDNLTYEVLSSIDF